MPLLLFFLAEGVAWADGKGGKGGGDFWQAILVGPCLYLLTLACLAATALLSLALGRLEHVIALAERAGRRLEHRRALPVFWGVSAAILLYLLIALMANTGVLMPLAVALLAAALGLLGLGLGAAALTTGRALAANLGADTESLPALRLGLTWLFLTAFLPVVGWILLLWTAAAGVGSVLETLVRREG